jgi:glycosyltransferase involved in cell wall biosynthesis
MRVLYLSYDGMTDPLGQSQVMPYIIGLAKNGHSFTLISFEKRSRFEEKGASIRKLCQQHNISWLPAIFSTYPPYLSKLWDVYKMLSMSMEFLKKENVDIIHCRSYISAWVGVRLKKKFGCKVLFDMRGFWIDERVDGNLWDLDNVFLKYAYKRFKKIELRLLRNSHHIVSLTNAGETEMRKWLQHEEKHLPISVIPCSTDTSLFGLVTADGRMGARQKLDLKKEQFVLCYLGSVGTWYLLEAMLAFFKLLKSKRPTSVFLIITASDHELITEKFKAANLSSSDLILRSAERKEIPELLSAADMGVMFIKNAFSKIASSPTKLGEFLSMGIPVIGNTGIGDVEEIISKTGGGHLVKETTEEEFMKAIDNIPHLLSIDRNLIREKAIDYYDLTRAIHKYQSIYATLEN